MSELICKNLTLGYDGKAVLSNVTFTVNPGDFLSVVGENGSGKSTLIKALTRLNPPISGEIILGEGLSQSDVGYMPQQTVAQKDFPATVTEIVRSGFLNRMGMRPFYNAAEKKLAQDNLRRLDIEDLSKSCFRELSGGQQQRVLLARALCATNKLLILDEPTSGLDPNASAELYTVLKSLNESKTTLVVISHDIEASVNYSSHILHIGQSSILFYGTTADYLESDVGRRYAKMGVE